MQNTLIGWAVLLFLASVFCAVLSMGNYANFGSIAMGLVSLGFSIAGGLALVAAALYKGDK